MTLEQFLSESIRVCREHGYPPTTFERMWNDARRQGSLVEEVIAFSLCGGGATALPSTSARGMSLSRIQGLSLRKAASQ